MTTQEIIYTTCEAVVGTIVLVLIVIAVYKCLFKKPKVSEEYTSSTLDYLNFDSR